MRLDPLDAQIIRLLQEDARLSFREIAERVGSTTPTVSARVRALEDLGILRRYRAELDHAILGGASYVVTLTLHPRSAEGGLEAVGKLPGTYAAYLLPGGRVVAHVHLRPPGFTLAHLHESLADVPGLQSYDAAEVIRSHEASATEELPENVQVPCHQCRGPIHDEPIKAKFADRTHVFCCRQCLGTFRERFERTKDAATGAAAKPPAPPATKPAAKGHAHHHHH